MNHSIIKIVFSTMLAMVITVCGAAPIKPASGPMAAAAYGNISLPSGVISSVLLYKVGEGNKPPTEWPHKGHIFANGDFFFENVKPGTYFLKGFTAGKERFNFKYGGVDAADSISKAAVEIKPGSISYMGSYDVVGIDKRFKKGPDFEIVRSKTAVRILILKNIKEQSKSSGWDKQIERAMK
jgi:hypothetical protein